MKIVFSAKANRELKKLDRVIQIRIAETLHRYTTDSNPLRFADKLTDARFGTLRFRIGDYRLLCDIYGQTIIVVKVGHRKDIYR